jgi:hypothetical protein
VELAQPACDEMVELGWLKVEHREKDGAGRSALPIHHINPKVEIVRECIENNTD